jgi:hypothetical protein
VSSVVAGSFQDTMTTKFTASDVKKVIVVMLLYGAMWGTGLFGIILCSARHEKNRRYTESGKTSDLKTAFTSQTRSKEGIRESLTAYGERFLCDADLIHPLLDSDRGITKCLPSEGWSDPILGGN